jgi:hypothetical protein
LSLDSDWQVKKAVTAKFSFGIFQKSLFSLQSTKSGMSVSILKNSIKRIGLCEMERCLLRIHKGYTTL